MLFEKKRRNFFVEQRILYTIRIRYSASCGKEHILIIGWHSLKKKKRKNTKFYVRKINFDIMS